MTEKQGNVEERKEVGLYEKLALRSKELIEEARDKTAETAEAAIEKAKAEMIAAGEFGSEQGERLKTFLIRDLQATGDAASKMGKTALEMLEPHRVAAGAQSILAKILDTVGGTLEEWGSKLEVGLDYKTGEMTTPGTMTCRECGNSMKILNTGHIPPCHKCRGTKFRKSY
ncbi:MAG: hypothetical protein Q7J27_10425 [Syntrophales bacterium]|nr:hypothetical protein [Syntrophales bacterium]